MLIHMIAILANLYQKFNEKKMGTYSYPYIPQVILTADLPNSARNPKMLYFSWEGRYNPSMILLAR
jgi:hypothetical protein